MRKGLFVSVIIASLIVGVALGGGGHWYFADHLPKVRMMAMAKKQQEQLNRMVRSGDVTEVKPDSLTVRVTHSGDPQFNGKTITVKTDQYTSVQAGMDFISKPGQATDLTKYLKPGMHVDLLVNGNKVVAVHWNPPGQGQPGQNGQGQSKQ